MLTEKDLLIDIIKDSPKEAIWSISSDSLQYLPQSFPIIQLPENGDREWGLIINDNNRNLLLNLIEEHQLDEKIIHQDITFNNEVIFESYDGMSGSYIKNTFPSFEDIFEKYKESELLYILK